MDLYYSVGKPICYRTGSYLDKERDIEITKEAVKNSFGFDENIILFTTEEEAQNYAKSLHIYTPLKTPLHRNMAAPIFSLEILENSKLGDLMNATVTYMDFISSREKEVEISFYVVKQAVISHLIEAKFVNDRLPVFKFNDRPEIGCGCNLI